MIWDFIREQLAHNQLATGGLVLMILGGLVHYCRAIPMQLYRHIKRQFVVEIDVPDRDQAFDWINEWIAVHPYGKRARLLTVSTKNRERNQPTIILSPAPGTHYFFYKRRFVSLRRDRSDGPQQSSNGPAMPAMSRGGWQKESFIIRIYSRDRNLAVELLEDARELVVPKDDDRITLLRARYNNWNTVGKRLPRPIESVILKEGQMEALIADIEKFQNSKNKKWYIERGIPYRRGYLLHGPPGSGKSSIVVALASQLKLNIALVSLSGKHIGDDDLASLMAEVPERSVILIEDIDCVFHQRESKDDDQTVTFSGLLNAIDGVAAGEGHLPFMTSNHPGKLDSALIRPGRADVHVEVGTRDRHQIEAMFRRFFPNEPSGLAEKFSELIPPDTSMAAIQGHLLMYSADPYIAIDEVVTIRQKLFEASNAPSVQH